MILRLSGRRTGKPASRPPFILSLPLLFRFGFYPAVNVCARSFRAAGMYYDPNKRSRRIVYELLASPKATKACIFIENSTFISAAFDYRSKDNNDHKKGAASVAPSQRDSILLRWLIQSGWKGLFIAFLSGPTSNGLLGSKPMTKKLLLGSFVATITWPEKERQGLHFLFCYWGKLQRLEINGGALGEEKGRKREQHELKQRGLRSLTQKKTRSHFASQICVRYETFQVKNRLPPSGWIPEMLNCTDRGSFAGEHPSLQIQLRVWLLASTSLLRWPQKINSSLMLEPDYMCSETTLWRSN